VHFSRVGSRQEIPSWVRHVFLCLLAPVGIEPSTVVVGRAAEPGGPSAVRFLPIANAEEIAADLIDLYRAGQREPLPLLPDPSRAFAEAYRKRRDESAGLAAAARLEQRRNERGERIRDADVELVFRGRDPYAPAAAGAPAGERLGFAEVALRFFGPLLEHARDA
jgi:exonuclease V gamma subunit